MKKRIISLLLICFMLTQLIPVTELKADNRNDNTMVLSLDRDYYITYNLDTDDPYVKVYSKDMQLEQSVILDRATGIIYEQINNTENKQRIFTVNQYNCNDYIEDVPVKYIEEEKLLYTPFTQTIFDFPSYNYLINEPMMTNSGLTYYGEGYYYIGKCNQYTGSPMGYLNRSMKAFQSQKKTFTFTPGMTVGTVVMIIIESFITATIPVATLLYLLGENIVNGVIAYICRPTLGFQYTHYKYRVMVETGDTLRLGFSYCRLFEDWIADSNNNVREQHVYWHGPTDTQAGCVLKGINDYYNGTVQNICCNDWN